MSAKTFVDTNVLIYAHDADSPAKRGIANRILGELWAERTGALSVQVLEEFYIHVTRKIARPLPKASARRVVDAYAIGRLTSRRQRLPAPFASKTTRGSDFGTRSS